MRKSIFIDTEYTNLLDPVLISLGMVADTGEEFYAEVDYPDAACTAVVREAVLPLLGREPHAAMTRDEFPMKVITWLNLVRERDQEVDICIDDQTDWDLFADAMDYRVPAWCHKRLVSYDISDLLVEEFHRNTGLPRHHALYDARANRHAFREPIKAQDNSNLSGGSDGPK
jgi:hypothetical protein